MQKELKKYIKEPTTVSFVTTYRCSSACKNCCFHCSPKRKGELSYEEICGYLEQIKRDFPMVKVLVLTGGECTLLKHLTKIIYTATHVYGLYVRIVTNGHWARTYDSATSKISEWKSAGLTEINFSTGDEHLEYVPIEYIKNAILASTDNGFIPYINVEAIDGHIFNTTFFMQDERMTKLIKEKKLFVMNGIWIDFENPENGRLCWD